MNPTLAKRQLLQPASLQEALRMLHEERPLRPLAGCTDLFVEAEFGRLQENRFLDLWSLQEMARVEMRGELLVMGARATFTDLQRSGAVRAHLPMLAQAAATIGAVQIQNRATLGGNIANASPAGDSLPVLMAADGVVVLTSVQGERRVPLTDFYTGYRRTVRREDELITAVEVAPVAGRQYFRKVGTRAAQAISKVVLAAVVGDQPRVALGSVAPTVRRLWKTEAVLAKSGDLDQAERVLQTEIEPIDDMRSTAAYRRAVAGRLLKSAFA